MKKIILFLFVLLIGINCKSQNNALIIKDNSNIVMTGTSHLVIDQSSSNAIKRTGINKNGCIISNDEQSRLIWNIGNSSSGSYTFPYQSTDGDTVPVVISINSAGTQTTDGQILVSTYHTGNNNQPLPSSSSSFFSDVTNINNALGEDNSSNMLDRYWIICFNNYSIKPSLTANFYYDANGATNDLNSINESNLRVQRWDGTQWVLPETGTLGTHCITGVSGINYSAPWTLVDKNEPLPINMLSFNTECKDENILLKWITVSETNNDYFTIERSADGVDFVNVGTIDGAGNSNTLIQYSFEDVQVNNSSDLYYRLRQTDYDGIYTITPVITINCSKLNINIAQIYPNPANDEISVDINCSESTSGIITLYNTVGQGLINQAVYLQKGKTVITVNVSTLASGIYSLIFRNNLGVYCRSKEAIVKK